jgi:hypothetical protein
MDDNGDMSPPAPGPKSPAVPNGPTR